MKLTFTENPYPYKHWLTSIAIGSLYSMSFEWYPIFFMMSLLYSLPVFVIYLILFSLLVKMGTSPFMIKVILNVVAVFGTMATLHLIDGTLAMTLALAYSIALVLSSFFFRIKLTTAES